MRLSFSFALCLPASRRFANIKLRRSLRPGFFFITIPPKFLLPAPAPWPYIADFTRPEGHTHLACPALPEPNMVRKSPGTALQSYPALALQGKSLSLAVVSPYGAPMPHTKIFFIFLIPPRKEAQLRADAKRRGQNRKKSTPTEAKKEKLP